MDEERWDQSSVSEAPEAVTSGVRHAEDGAGPPVPETPPRQAPVSRHAGDRLLRGVQSQPLAALLIAVGVGFGLSLLGRFRFG